jgi:ligand-binding sensor domain-containing protein/serine phosphatase RsbU (regulator of sigma subunit)
MKKNNFLRKLIVSSILFFFTFYFNSFFSQNISTKNTQNSQIPFTSDTIYLKNCPPPEVVLVPTNKTELEKLKIKYKNQKFRIGKQPKVIQLPLLKNEKGEIVKDKNGNPYILDGSGGFTYIKKFTTDNGLISDRVNHLFIDKIGRLWCGTKGGVSCFDGKKFINYTTKNGLISNMIDNFYQDTKGNLWFLSLYGISCFDGKKFINILTTNWGQEIEQIYEDKKGKIWFATSNGAICFDGKNFTNYTTKNGLVNDNVNFIIEDKRGNLWFATDSGTSCFNGKNFINYTIKNGLISNKISKIFRDKKNNLWFISGWYDSKGVSCFDGKNFINYTIKNDLISNNIFIIYEDKKGNLWFGTDKGISCFDGKKFINFSKKEGLTCDEVYNFLEDKKGNLWLTTDNGFFCFNGKFFINFKKNEKNGSLENYFLDIKEDKNGNIWLSSIENGLISIDINSFIAITNFNFKNELSGKIVRSIAEDKFGNIWFGTNNGAYMFDYTKLLHFTEKQGLNDSDINCIIKDKNGNLWIRTFGITKFDGNSFTNYTSYNCFFRFGRFFIIDLSSWGYEISEDKKGNLWIGFPELTKCAYYYFDNKKCIKYVIKNTQSNLVNCFSDDTLSNIWLGTTSQGIYCFNEHSLKNFTTQNGLADNFIYSMASDKKGNLWIGSTNGLSLLKYHHLKNINSSSSQKNNNLFINFTTQDGLPSNTITQILIDDNKLWIGTEAGICELLPDSSSQKGYSVGKIYSTYTEYPINKVRSGKNAMYKDSKGIIWIATNNPESGLVRFDPSAITKNTNPPTIVIEDIKINNQNICWYSLSEKDSTTLAQQEILFYGKVLSNNERDSLKNYFKNIRFDSISRWYAIPQKLVLPYEFNHITFNFNAIELRRNHLVKYQYKLEGYDKDWSPVTDINFATYGNISEGTYTFKVKARSPDGVWSKPVTYTFTVLPPWYRTWWMYSVYGIISILMVYAIVIINNRRLRKRAEELAEEVRKATVTILEQKEKIELKNKDIMDSIIYALRIQKAILPDEKKWNKLLPDSFKLYLPKDVLAGDFYWLEENENYIYVAAADCTGHGVPGAMVSVVCSSALTKAVLEDKLTNTNKILDRVREIVVEKLSSNEGQLRDGMDVCLVRINKNNRKEIQYSGANRPLFIIKANGVLEELSPDKQTIGWTEETSPFKAENKVLEQGDMLYLTTDGYADQFGGEKGKKFKAANLKKLLLSIQNENMEQQKIILQQTFNQWKANLEQVDDVLVIGVKI